MPHPTRLLGILVYRGLYNDLPEVVKSLGRSGATRFSYACKFFKSKWSPPRLVQTLAKGNVELCRHYYIHEIDA